MRPEALRLLIQRKIDAGSLPRDGVPRLWGAYANADSCDACDEMIRGTTYVMEGIWIDGDGKRALQFHVQCFSLWDELRRTPGT